MAHEAYFLYLNHVFENAEWYILPAFHISQKHNSVRMKNPYLITKIFLNVGMCSNYCNGLLLM